MTKHRFLLLSSYLSSVRYLFHHLPSCFKIHLLPFFFPFFFCLKQFRVCIDTKRRNRFVAYLLRWYSLQRPPCSVLFVEPSELISPQQVDEFTIEYAFLTNPLFHLKIFLFDFLRKKKSEKMGGGRGRRRISLSFFSGCRFVFQLSGIDPSLFETFPLFIIFSCHCGFRVVNEKVELVRFPLSVKSVWIDLLFVSSSGCHDSSLLLTAR